MTRPTPMTTARGNSLWRRLTAGLAALAVALGTLAAAAPAAKADPPGWRAGHGGWHSVHDRRWRRTHHHHRPKVVEHRRVVVHHYDRGPAYSSGPSLNGGHLIGGVLGAILGSRFGSGKGKAVAVVGGGILGAVIGGAIGDSMDRADHARTQTVLETTPTGRSVEWTNPDSGATYTVTPTQTYDSGNGAPCRDYTTWVFIDGYEEQATGTACRAEDGTWRTVPAAEARARRSGEVDIVYADPGQGAGR